MNDGKYLVVKMNGAALVFDVRERFSYSLRHTQTLVPNNEFHTAQNFPVTVLIDCDYY